MKFLKKLYAKWWLNFMDYCPHGVYNPCWMLPFNCPTCMADPDMDYSDREKEFAEEQARAKELAGWL